MFAQARDLVAELAVLRGELLALEAGELGEAHLEDGLGLTLGEEVVALRLRPRRSPLSGRPARRTNASRPLSGSAMSAIARASSVSRDARIVLMTRSTSVIAMPRPSTISRWASAWRSSKRVRRVTTSRRCSTKTASVCLRSSTCGRPRDDREVDDAERRLQIRQPIELVDDDLRERRPSSAR